MTEKGELKTVFSGNLFTYGRVVANLDHQLSDK